MKERTGSRQIFITDFDLERLEALIADASAKTSRDSRYLDDLGDELLSVKPEREAGGSVKPEGQVWTLPDTNKGNYRAGLLAQKSLGLRAQSA